MAAPRRALVSAHIACALLLDKPVARRLSPARRLPHAQSLRASQVLPPEARKDAEAKKEVRGNLLRSDPKAVRDNRGEEEREGRRRRNEKRGTRIGPAEPKGTYNAPLAARRRTWGRALRWVDCTEVGNQPSVWRFKLVCALRVQQLFHEYSSRMTACACAATLPLRSAHPRSSRRHPPKSRTRTLRRREASPTRRQGVCWWAPVTRLPTATTMWSCSGLRAISPVWTKRGSGWKGEGKSGRAGGNEGGTGRLEGEGYLCPTPHLCVTTRCSMRWPEFDEAAAVGTCYVLFVLLGTLSLIDSVVHAYVLLVFLAPTPSDGRLPDAFLH